MLLLSTPAAGVLFAHQAGLVTNEQVKDMAEFDAWYVFGVDRVINSLAVQE